MQSDAFDTHSSDSLASATDHLPSACEPPPVGCGCSARVPLAACFFRFLSFFSRLRFREVVRLTDRLSKAKPE